MNLAIMVISGWLVGSWAARNDYPFWICPIILLPICIISTFLTS